MELVPKELGDGAGTSSRVPYRRYLGYTRRDTKHKDAENSLNGHSKERVVTSVLGDFTLALPRDRHSFDPLIIKKHQKRMPSTEDHVSTSPTKITRQSPRR